MKRPRDLSQLVMADEDTYALTREKEKHDYPYFKQVLILYWIEKNTDLP